MESSKLLKIKKSEVSFLASSVVDVLDLKIKKGTNITAVLELFGSNENKAELTASIEVSGEVTYKDIMRIFRRKLSPYITLKAHKMNLKLTFGNKKAESGLFAAKYFFTGRKIDRYKVFNALFILCSASNENLEVVPTGDDF